MSLKPQFVAILICFLSICILLVVSQDESPLTVELESFEVVKGYDTKFLDWNSLRMIQKSRNHFVINGTVKANLNLADEQSINVQLFTYNSKQKMRGLLIFNMEKKLCKFMADDEYIYPGLMEVSNLPEQGTCPLPKGEYNIKDYDIRVDFLPQDTPDGDYLAIGKLKNGLNPVAALEIYINVKHKL